MEQNVIELNFGKYPQDYRKNAKTNVQHVAAKQIFVNEWKNVIADKVISTLKTDSLDTIDRAMDIQQILFEFSQIINSYYRFQLLIVILTAFIIIVFDCYYLMEVLNNPKQRQC